MENGSNYLFNVERTPESGITKKGQLSEACMGVSNSRPYSKNHGTRQVVFCWCSHIVIFSFPLTSGREFVDGK